MHKLLSTAEAAELLGVAEQTLRLWRYNKRQPIHSVKIGRIVKYDEADIRAFVERLKVSRIA